MKKRKKVLKPTKLHVPTTLCRHSNAESTNVLLLFFFFFSSFLQLQWNTGTFMYEAFVKQDKAIWPWFKQQTKNNDISIAIKRQRQKWPLCAATPITSVNNYWKFQDYDITWVIVIFLLALEFTKPFKKADGSFKNALTSTTQKALSLYSFNKHY